MNGLNKTAQKVSIDKLGINISIEDIQMLLLKQILVKLGVDVWIGFNNDLGNVYSGPVKG